MNAEKFDAPLRIHLSQIHEPFVDVSIRLHSPLDEREAAEMEALGLHGIDTRRRVLFSKLPATVLESLAQFKKVARISLSQPMQMKVPPPSG